MTERNLQPTTLMTTNNEECFPHTHTFHCVFRRLCVCAGVATNIKHRAQNTEHICCSGTARRRRARHEQALHERIYHRPHPECGKTAVAPPVALGLLHPENPTTSHPATTQRNRPSRRSVRGNSACRIINLPSGASHSAASPTPEKNPTLDLTCYTQRRRSVSLFTHAPAARACRVSRACVGARA